MSYTDPTKRWRLSKSADATDRLRWTEALELPIDRRGNRARNRIVRSLWRRGAIEVKPAFADAETPAIS